jgi:hypothetical protein
VDELADVSGGEDDGHGLALELGAERILDGLDEQGADAEAVSLEVEERGSEEHGMTGEVLGVAGAGFGEDGSDDATAEDETVPEGKVSAFGYEVLGKQRGSGVVLQRDGLEGWGGGAGFGVGGDQHEAEVIVLEDDTGGAFIMVGVDEAEVVEGGADFDFEGLALAFHADGFADEGADGVELEAAEDGGALGVNDGAGGIDGDFPFAGHGGAVDEGLGFEDAAEADDGGLVGGDAGSCGVGGQAGVADQGQAEAGGVEQRQAVAEEA